MQDSPSVQISIGAKVVTKAHIAFSQAIEYRLDGDHAVLSLAGGMLEVTLTEPALETLIDAGQEVFNMMLERH